MASNLNTPTDLNDNFALRRYLQNIESRSTNTRYIERLETSQKPYQLSILSSVELDSYVKTLAKAFDDKMWKTINEVKYNLATLIPTEDTIVKTIEDELAIETSNINASISSLALVAVDADGSWAKTTYVDQQRSAIELELTTNYATVDIISSTYATNTAVGAIYEVAVEANGHVSGYRSVATGTSSVFQIYAEQFAISSSLTDEGYSPFQVDTANHKINMTSDVAIDGNLLVSKSITANQIAANTITTAELGVIGVATFTNDAGYTDDTTVNYILDGTTALNPNIVSLGTKTLSEYISAEVDAQVVVYSGTNYTTQTGMKENDLYIESTTETSSSGIVVDVVNTYKYNGTSWVQINNNSNLTALADLTDGKRTVYSGTTLPGSPEENDIWIPEIGVVGYVAKEIYKYNGTSWVIPVKYTDDTIATSAYNLADSKATLAEVQSQGYVLPDGVANAINTNTTKVEGAKIVTGSINALQIAANTITADELNVSNVQAAVVTAAYINALTITADSVAAENITGTTITGKTISGGTITGTTINASTINIRNLNLVNDSGYTTDPFFTLSPSMIVTGTDPRLFIIETDMYTYNSTNTSTKRTIGTTGTKAFIAELDSAVTSSIWAPVGYLPIAASIGTMTFDVDIMVGTTTLATRTSFSTNTDYDIGGFVFRYHYDAAQSYDYTFCIKTSTNNISVASTSSNPIKISMSVNPVSSMAARLQGFSMLVSNL